MTDTKQPEALPKFRAIDFINTEEELEAYVSGRMRGLQAGYDAAVAKLKDMAAGLAAAPKAEPALVGEQDEPRGDASYESMNLAAMVLSDCGHSSNYKPLLERVAGRIDRHVERLLTAQQADRAVLAEWGAPQQEAQEPCGWTTGITWRPGTRLQSEQVIKITRDAQPKYGFTTPIYTAPQPAPVAQGDALSYEQSYAIRQGHEIASSDAYFKARPQIDGLDRRNVFRAGFERGWNAARAQAKEGGV